MNLTKIAIKAILLSFLAFPAINSYSKTSDNSITQNTNWSLIKSENGINVYVSTYEWIDGELKLQVKFENTNAHDVNLSWEISSNATDKLHRAYQIAVKANSSIEFSDDQNPIAIPVGKTEKDFIINFK